MFHFAKNYAKWLTKCGVNVTEKWLTATEQASALNEAYMRGMQDERDRFAELQEEYNNDFCEWKKKNSNEYVCNAHAEIHDSRVLDWRVCPYCGKKIKVVE